MGETTTRRRPKRSLMLDSMLAYFYVPILPYLKKIHITRAGPRHYKPEDILLPDGYTAELVCSGFSAPVHCCFDQEGYCYVSESGHKSESPPRIWKVDVQSGRRELLYEVPPERWNKTGALTGACWYREYLYFMNTDTLCRLHPEGTVQDIITDLPSLGDHQSNHPVLGPDEKIYWGQGTMTNTGVVGADNFAYEWLPTFPDLHDVPGEDITLTGRNYEYKNVLGDVRETVYSGAFVPFGVSTHPGQVVKGVLKCNGAIMRCNPDGTNLERVCWGLRNPYGLAFSPQGRLYCTEHNIDERSQRFIVGDTEDLYEINSGAWYGWPDYAAGIRLDDPYWGRGGRGREPVIANPPDPNPPKPLVTFPPHAAANGLTFSHDDDFFGGDAFVCLFGDISPLTAPQSTPTGFKVVRVDVQKRVAFDFAVNKIEGPASKLPHAGFERPCHLSFGPDGALYIVDWGEIELAPEVGGIRMKQETGALWRIRRTGGPSGEEPPRPLRVPLYGIEWALVLAGAAGVAGGAVALARWLRRSSDGRGDRG